MNTAIFDLDQQRCQTEAVIAQSLYIDGESDGFDGVKPTSSEPEYLLGYASGCRFKLDDIQNQYSSMSEVGRAVEAMLEEF